MEKLYETQDDDGEQEATKRINVGRGMPSRFRLVVMLGERGNATYPLPKEGEVVIGRSSACDVRIDDAKLSRRHAALRMGAKIEILDLGSVNGTRVGTRSLVAGERVTVSPGEMIVFGSTIALVQAASLSSQMRHVWTHAHFEARLGDECTRAALSKGGFAVVRIHFGSHSASLLESTFEHWMRPMDLAASYSPHEWEFLLAGVGREEASAIAARARSIIERVVGPVDIGVATYPAEGRTPEKLIAAAGRFREVGGTSSVRMQVGFLEQIRPLLERVASGNISILIGGETGAGKEVLAHAIHRASPRASGPMLCLNCAALSETLLESELFGHERGAFTGATQAKAGLLETADGGTVFLDEIGEMPPTLQAKLLRVIQERQVQRVGGLKPRPINVRFVSATNRDLEAEVARGTFRQDLYYRLNGVVMTVPPLRDRKDEIEPLARAFIAQCAEQLGAREPRLSGDVVTLLQSYPWPGNIRELRNVIERAVLLCEDGVITLENVPYERMQARSGNGQLGAGATVPPMSESARTSEFARPDLTPAAAPTGIRATPAGSEAERACVIAALEACSDNQTKAAKFLGISRNTLIARLNQYGLARPRKRAE